MHSPSDETTTSSASASASGAASRPARASSARTWLLTLGTVLALLLASHFWQTRHMQHGAAPNAAFVRVQAAGVQQTLDQWRQQHAGQAVVLYFWATWCPVCRAEQPLIDDMVQHHPVLPVALQSGPAGAVAQYEQQHGLRWNSALDPQGALAAAFGVPGTPAFVVINAKGEIASRTVGLTSPWGLRLRLWWAGLAG